jgi:hypothetical protein
MHLAREAYSETPAQRQPNLIQNSPPRHSGQVIGQAMRPGPGQPPTRSPSPPEADSEPTVRLAPGDRITVDSHRGLAGRGAARASQRPESVHGEDNVDSLLATPGPRADSEKRERAGPRFRNAKIIIICRACILSLSAAHAAVEMADDDATGLSQADWARAFLDGCRFLRLLQSLQVGALPGPPFHADIGALRALTVHQLNQLSAFFNDSFGIGFRGRARCFREKLEAFIRGA